MILNIKNEETHQFGKDPKQLTGKTMTGAITIALREKTRQRKTRAQCRSPNTEAAGDTQALPQQGEIWAIRRRAWGFPL